MEKTNQVEEVRKYLEKNGSITSMEAIQEFGATRLSAIIFILRERGYKISTKTKTSKNRFGNVVNYAEYVLEGE